jgi:hypothetical protein
MVLRAGESCRRSSSWQHTACRKVRDPMLEPYVSKGARPVLRGGSAINAAALPDRLGE